MEIGKEVRNIVSGEVLTITWIEERTLFGNMVKLCALSDGTVLPIKAIGIGCLWEPMVERGMKVWTCIDFMGLNPVQLVAVLVAETAEKAAELANKALTEKGLEAHANPGTMIEVTTNKERCVILIGIG